MWYFAGIEAREKGGPSLSISISGKEGEEHLVFDNGADLSFRSVRYRHRWKFFKKRRKEIQGVG